MPLLAIVGGVASGWLPVWPGRPWEFAQNLTPIAVCYLGSVTYHAMMAHHQKYHLWITLDVSLTSHCLSFILTVSFYRVGAAESTKWEQPHQMSCRIECSHLLANPALLKSFLSWPDGSALGSLRLDTLDSQLQHVAAQGIGTGDGLRSCKLTNPVVSQY